MQSLETWKGIQRKNQRRRTVGCKRALHRRLMNRLPPSERILRHMRNARRPEKSEVQRVLMPATKRTGLINKMMNLFAQKSQRGS